MSIPLAKFHVHMSSRRLHDWYGRLRMLADQALTQVYGDIGPATAMRYRRKSRPLQLSDLESRLLYSATPLDPALLNPAALAGEPSATVLQVETVTAERSIAVKEIVVIDSSVPELDALLNDIISAREGAEVYILDSGRDGVTQISEILEGRMDLTGLHIVSHGADSSVRLGNTWLGSENLNGYAGEIASWRSSFATEADILFYGCDVAAGPTGQELLASIGALSGTEVAASTNDTGHADHRADWQLEYQTGSIETNVIFSQQLQSAWSHKLAAVTIYVNTFDDVVAADGLTSLREAIMEANANVGDDVTIVLQSGVYHRSINTINEDSAASGDLDITRSVTILGAGVDQTTIDASTQDRVLDIHGGSVLLSDVTIRGGDVGADGGGIRINVGASLTLQRALLTQNVALRGGAVANFGTLTMTDVEIRDNGSSTTTDKGGGLYNAGEATLGRVTLAGNQSQNGGGGIYNAAGGDLELTNVTLSGNAAGTGEGGALYNNSAVSIVNATITGNSAHKGGGISNLSGTITVLNTIVTGNTADVGVRDVRGAVTGLGNNVVQDVLPNMGFAPSEQFLAGANLAALADNGGFVRTHVLLVGSPALGGGNQALAPTVDARGVLRSDTVDVGAFQNATPQIIPTNPSQTNTHTGSGKNTTSGPRGSTSSIASDEAGNYVVVWTSTGGQDGDGDGIFGQRFSATGARIGTEFQINQSSVGNQNSASVAMNASGTFVVTWTAPGSSGSDTTIMARRFNASGLAIGDAFVVSASTPDGQHQTSAVAIDDEGRFSVTWMTSRASNDTWIYLRSYASDGIEIGSVQTVDSMTNSLAGVLSPSIDMNAGGQVVVVYEKSGDVRFQRFDVNRNADGPSVKVAEAPLLVVSTQADVAIADDGSFVIVWSDGDASRDIFMQRFAAHGSEIGSAINLHTGLIDGDQSSPTIAMDDSGDFIVSWSGSGTGDADGVYFQKFDSSGNTIGAIVRANTTTSGNQQHASLTMLDSDNFAIVWSDSNVFVCQYGTGVSLPSNQAPIGADDLHTIDEDETLTGGSVLANDTDPDGNPLSANLISGPSHSQAFTLNLNGTFEYIPTAGYSGIDTFVYEASDGNLSSDPVTVSITVNAVNDPPTLAVTPALASIAENADVSTSIKVADAVINDDGIGTNQLTLSGADAALFELAAGGTELHLKAGVSLDYETNASLDVNVVVTDPTLDPGPADSAALLITVTNSNDPAMGRPSLVGFASVGETLGVDASAISDADGLGVYSYQWYRNNLLVVGAESSTYLLTQSDAGTTIRVAIRFIDDNSYLEGPLLSDASAQVMARFPNPGPISAPPASTPEPGSSTPETPETPDFDEGDDTGDSNNDSGSDDGGLETLPLLDAASMRSTGTTGGDAEETNNEAVAVAETVTQKRINALASGHVQGDALNMQMSESSGDRSSRSARQSGFNLDGMHGEFSPEEARSLVMADYALMTRPGAMWEQLDNYQSNVDSRIRGDLIVVGSAGAAASSFTVGVLAWAMRGGFLVSGLIAQMPAWTGLDPLLIMNGVGGSAMTGGETLEELMQRQQDELTTDQQ